MTAVSRVEPRDASSTRREPDGVREQQAGRPGRARAGPCRLCAVTDEAEERRIVALLDSPNPDVLELRRLTPAQAAAAAKAAARQEARVEKLKAVPDAERKPKGDDDWTDGGGGAIAQLMEKTPLIDLEWVIDLIELGGTVPRCQDVPNAAVLTASMVWRLAIAADFMQLPVLVLSYPSVAGLLAPGQAGGAAPRLAATLQGVSQLPSTEPRPPLHRGSDDGFSLPAAKAVHHRCRARALWRVAPLDQRVVLPPLPPRCWW